MSVNYKNDIRSGGRIIPVTVSQRSSCIAVVYRYDQTAITKLTTLNSTSDQSIKGRGTGDASGNLKTKSRLVIKNDIINCSVSKDKTSSSGTFSMTLKQGRQIVNGKILNSKIEYVNAIHPGDWVMIYMKKKGDDESINVDSVTPASGFKFMGIVEEVRQIEMDDPSSGTPQLTYLVTGRDWGKIFDMSIFFNPLLGQEANSTILGVDFLKDSSNSVSNSGGSVLTGNTPDVVMKRLLSFYLGGKLQNRTISNELWYIPQELANIFFSQDKNKGKGKSVIDILNTERIGLPTFSNNKFQSAKTLPGACLIKALPANGTVWSAMQFLSNSARNELYTDLTVKDGKLTPSVILRQLPFSNKPDHETNIFFSNSRSPTQGGSGQKGSDGIPDSEKTYFTDLPRLEIPSTELKSKNIGKSEFERINHVITIPRIDNQTLDIAYTLVFNTPSIQRYGLQSIQIQTAYVLGGSAEQIKLYCAKTSYLVADWFFNSHQLFNGSLLLDGLDQHVELGSNLFLTDVQQLFHIEGYTHTYSVNPTGIRIYNTELRVSRGQRLERGKTFFIGPSSKAYDPVTIGSYGFEGDR